MTKYKKAKDKEWIQPIKKGYLMACCDCGLVHKMDFRIVKDRVQFRASRAVKKTKMLRRKHNIKVNMK